MAQVSQPVSGGGVILNPPPSRDSKSRTWCFTVNNYDQSIIDLVVSTVSKNTVLKYIYGFERGDQGTPHIQGYIRFKNQVRFSTVKRKLPTAHWEVAKGTDDDNYVYCSKEGDFRTNYRKEVTQDDLKQMVLKEYDGVTWKPWQKDMLEMAGTHDERIVTWIYESSGNVGKSYICRYLCCQPGTLLCSGKKADIFNQLANMVLEEKEQPRLVLVDIPRAGKDFVSYEALECLKNGCIYSGKYIGGRFVFPKPTVIAFANQPPRVDALSKDRWRIYKIQDDQLFLQPTVVDYNYSNPV